MWTSPVSHLTYLSFAHRLYVSLFKYNLKISRLWSPLWDVEWCIYVYVVNFFVQYLTIGLLNCQPYVAWRVAERVHFETAN